MQNKIKISSVLVSVILLASIHAKAALGQREDSINQDMAVLATTAHTSSTLTYYSVHEIGSDGLKVKEYVSKTGIVFGVSWRGNGVPDLSLLFGDYFKDYSEAIKHPLTRKFRSAQSVTNAGSVIVEKSGHLRDLYGRAFVPALLPSGATSDEIK